MNIPNLLQTPLVDKDRHMSSDWVGVFSQLIGQMQQHVSNDGFIPPQQTTETINKLNNAKSTAAIIYDSTTKQMKVNIDGQFKVFTVT